MNRSLNIVLVGRNFFKKILLVFSIFTLCFVIQPFVYGVDLPGNSLVDRSEREYFFPDIVAYVDDMAITKEELQNFLVLTQQFEIDSVVNETMARQVVANYVAYLQLVELAKTRGLDKQNMFSERIRFLEMFMLVDEYYVKQVEEDPNLLNSIKDYYYSIKNNIDAREYNLYQIIFETKETAQIAIDNISEGRTTFDALLAATAESEIERVEKPSNHMGWVNIWQQPMFSDLENLTSGDMLSYPIATDYGYHIIYVEARRQRPYLSFEELDENTRGNYIYDYYESVFLPEVSARINLKLEPSL